jgi:predicted phage terminase large subunit-like protein
MNRDVQRIIDSPEYAKVFDSKLFGKNIRSTSQGTYLRNSDIFEIVGHKGVYRSAGVGGGITGMGAKYAIIDDPFKNRQDANSQTIRQSVWEWYTSTLYTRLTPDARVLIIMTRWHEDDLVGRLIEQQKEEDSDHWRIISFPALSEPGREDEHEIDKEMRPNEGMALWPSRFDEKKLARIKTVIGSYEWASLFQQRPSPAEGAIFMRSWWQYWKEARHPSFFEEIIQSWDCTFKDTDGTDYVVGQVWGRRGADRYLLDQVRDRMNFPKTVDAIKKLKAKWPSTGAVLIEDTANGPAVIATLKHDIPGLIPVKPEGGKVVRAQAVTAQIEAGNVYLPSPEIAAWVGDFIEECAAFANGKHDDQVDSMTQALTRLGNRSPVTVHSWRPDNW